MNEKSWCGDKNHYSRPEHDHISQVDCLADDENCDGPKARNTPSIRWLAKTLSNANARCLYGFEGGTFRFSVASVGPFASVWMSHIRCPKKREAICLALVYLLLGPSPTTGPSPSCCSSNTCHKSQEWLCIPGVDSSFCEIRGLRHQKPDSRRECRWLELTRPFRRIQL